MFESVHRAGSRVRERRGNGAYEPVGDRAFAGPGREGTVVCDVGAHTGLLTLVAARRVDPHGRVFAFEPAPDTFETLQHHVSLNEYRDRVGPVRAVVADANGTTPFYVYGDSMSASGATIWTGSVHNDSPIRI